MNDELYCSWCNQSGHASQPECRAGFQAMRDYPYFCTDCNEGRARLTEDDRCTMCHGRRIITHVSQSKTQIGPVTVRFTVGRISDSSGIRQMNKEI